MKHEVLNVFEAEATPSRRRVHRSKAVLMMARLVADAADDLCLVCDISPLGARLRTVQEVVVKSEATLDFGDKLTVSGTVRWAHEGYCGVEFAKVVDLEPLFRRTGPHDRSRRVLDGDGAPARRNHPRLRRCAEVLLHRNSTSVPGELFDVSPMGGRIDLPATSGFAVGDRVSFAVEDRFDCEGVVRWVGPGSIGVAFDPPLRLWKLEKWLVDGLEKCGVCEVEACSAPAFKRVLARRPQPLAEATQP